MKHKKIKYVLGTLIILGLIYYIILATVGLPVVIAPWALKNTENADVIFNSHSYCHYTDEAGSKMYILRNNTLYTISGSVKSREHMNVVSEAYFNTVYKARKQIISKKDREYIYDCCENILRVSDLKYLYPYLPGGLLSKPIFFQINVL